MTDKEELPLAFQPSATRSSGVPVGLDKDQPMIESLIWCRPILGDFVSRGGKSLRLNGRKQWNPPWWCRWMESHGTDLIHTAFKLSAPVLSSSSAAFPFSSTSYNLSILSIQSFCMQVTRNRTILDSSLADSDWRSTGEVCNRADTCPDWDTRGLQDNWWWRRWEEENDGFTNMAAGQRDVNNS